MEIEYIYHSSDNNKEIEAKLKRIKKENTIGCLISSLVILSLLFIFLMMLPALLFIIGYGIIILVLYTIYKMYLEEHVLNFIQKHNLRR